MIAELFYPKELKEIIADLRAKDNLNEEALKGIRRQPLVFAVLWLFIVCLVYFATPLDFIGTLKFSIGLAVLGVLLVWGSVCSVFSRMKAYLTGEKYQGYVLGIYSLPPSSSVKVKIQNKNSNQIAFIGPFVQWHRTKECPQIGEKIYYYSIGKRMRHNMPNRIEIKEKYCLSKSMILENQ
ncbi:MAG: hypothetical protein ACRBB3_06765 [Alphaproteobacteria bacterium]